MRVLTYNNLDDVRELFAREGERIAAVLVEPVVGNMGLVEAESGFLEGVLALAAAGGALVIFDEVITWLRLGVGGAQGRFALRPDLTTVGKILGGGFPIAAFGGRADVMALLAPDGPVFTGGTHAGHPFAVAAAHAVLDELISDATLYPRLDAMARYLADGLRGIFAELELPYTVRQLESIVDFKFRPGPAVRNYVEASQADAQRFARYYHAMRERGILLAPSQNEVMFLSTEHTRAHIDETLAAAGEALRITR